jgi:transposase
MSEQKLNQEQREKIISLYAGGLSAEAIGRRFGVCAAQVRKIIKRTRDEG